MKTTSAKVETASKGCKTGRLAAECFSRCERHLRRFVHPLSGEYKGDVGNVCWFMLLIVWVVAVVGCGWSTEKPEEVIVYAALDREFSEPVLNDFEKQTGIKPLAKYDVESNKSVGLTQAIIAEVNRPRCDVFWNNEILNTLRLQEKGLLEAYVTPTAKSFPAAYRSSDGTWYGIAARARVLVVNTERVGEQQRPKSIYDLLDAKWKGQIGIAKPLFGTTATHAACLFVAQGDEEGKSFFRRLKANGVKVFGGNKQVAQAVASGEIAFGLTDTDDALAEVDAARGVTIVYPDRDDDELGTLFIPNTICIVKGCAHPAAARKLVDFLLSPAVEEQLARGASAQIPLSRAVDIETRVETSQTVHAMQVDFAAAARQWESVGKFLHDEFLQE